MWKHGLYIMTVFCMTLVIYPFEKKPKVNHISLVDWLLIIGSIAGSAYAIWEYLDRFMRLGMLTEMDIFFGCLMLFLGLEVGRRVIGWSLTLVSIVLILYSLYGFVIPGHFGHGGFDLEAVVTQVYAGMEGYYGLSAKMMIQYVAPFILMGAFLEKSGAGDFFIRLAFALTRNTVGGPAKAAVIGSALLGSISGSAVAFLMAEFTQIPYLTIVTVATGPIILYYITLMAFIHFEAKKHNIGQMKDHHIPSARTVCREGWHFFVAIMVIIVIMAFGYSPGMSALGGIITLIVIHSIKSRKVDFKMLYEAMVLGGRYSLGIGSLVGCIGIILSLVGLTGVGLKLSWLFTTLANGSPLVAILLVGLISMILGMGLASGPAYIVTAIAVGPALADMGFPLMTAHFIMMWFSIDSEITPPVGLASIVGAGIANADPMKTMFTAFKYAKALYILPILFYYRPALLLQSNLFDIALTFVTVMLGLIAFAAVWENYLMRRTTLLERLLLLSGALLLFIPGHIWDFAGIGLFIIVYCLQRYYCPAGFRQTA